IGPHSLRHSFITAALDAGVPLRDVQEAATHADPRMVDAKRVTWGQVNTRIRERDSSYCNHILPLTSGSGVHPRVSPSTPTAGLHELLPEPSPERWRWWWAH